MKPTPHIDRWRAETLRHLSDRGRKAELALYLSSQYGRTQRSWQCSLTDVLGGRQIPNGELVLAITAWLQQQRLH